MTDWQPTMARVTLFPAQGSKAPGALEVFRAVWGDEPDNFQRQQGNPLGASTAQAMRDGIMVTCQAMPVRIDVTFTAQPDLDAENPSSPLIENASALYAELDRVHEAVRDGKVVSIASRVALYLKYARLAENEQVAVDALRPVLPSGFTVAGEGADFQLQINTPRPGKIAGVRYNVLSRWSVEKYQLIAFAFPTGGPANEVMNLTPIPTQQEHVMATVSFDINNAPTSSSFDGETQGRMLDEQFDILGERHAVLTIGKHK